MEPYRTLKETLWLQELAEVSFQSSCFRSQEGWDRATQGSPAAVGLRVLEFRGPLRVPLKESIRVQGLGLFRAELSVTTQL